MIFQPAIIALLLAAALCMTMMLAATPFAVQLIRHWDLRSGSERQLRLERLTYLFSMLMMLVCVLQVLSTLLFVFNAERMSVMFVGAMCAVGTLNANAYGFPALYAQLLLFFAATSWLALNRVDNSARNYPLIRAKYAFMLALLPLAALVLYLQFNFFVRLEPDVITSCCGSMFSEDADTIASELSALPPRQAMLMFYLGLASAIALAAWQGWGKPARTRWRATAVGVSSGLAFAAALTGLLAFVALYIYEHPHHHCPFCILKAEYHYRGYLLYIPLFAAAAAGLGAALVAQFGRRPGLEQLAAQHSAALARIAALGFTLFVLIATAMIASSRLILLD